ncbi:MAG: cysteine hydrolase family protein [Erysipelotrichaceae bacterium]
MRISEEVLDLLEPISSEEMSKPLLFVVDMINGFVYEGALADPSIATIVPAITKLISLSDQVVFPCDMHPESAREFQAFPPHCEADSHESKVIDALEPYAKTIIPKNSTNTFLAPAFQEQLPHYLANHDDFLISGCCTDICVLQFALSFQAYLNEYNLNHKRIIVPVDSVETYGAPGHDATTYNSFALSLLKQSGVRVVKEVKE